MSSPRERRIQRRLTVEEFDDILEQVHSLMEAGDKVPQSLESRMLGALHRYNRFVGDQEIIPTVWVDR